MPIRKIKARQIFDARGDPTIEVDLITDVGLLRSSVPSVIFSFENQAKEIRDGEGAPFDGRSVLKGSVLNNFLTIPYEPINVVQVKRAIKAHNCRTIAISHFSFFILSTFLGSKAPFIIIHQNFKHYVNEYISK
jgi:hypothetical protein